MNDTEHDESLRLDTLRTYAILDTPPEADFDRLVRLAARSCRTPIATITLVDARRQWFKAATGLSLRETDRAIAFCAHAIRHRRIFVVDDAAADPEFAGNPLVTGDPRIRFYAGVPLVNPDGFALGTLAVIDTVPRTLSEEQEDSLQALAHQTMVLLEIRRKALALARATTLQRVAGRAARVGGWLIERDSGNVVWSDEVPAILEIETARDNGSPGIDEVLATFPPEFRDAFWEGVEACLLTGEPFDLEVPIVSGKGRHAWIRAIGEAVADANGRVVQIAGAIQDITEIRENREASHRLSERLARTLEGIGAFCTLDREWRFTFLNREAETLLGRKREDLIGKPVWAEFPPAAGTAFERQLRKAMYEGLSVSFEEHCPPLQRWFLVTAHPSSEGLAIHFQDSTGRRATEESLRRSEARFRAVAQATNDALWEWDIGAGTFWCNHGFTQVLGKPSADCVTNAGILLDHVHPEDREKVRRAYQEACAGERVSWQHEYRILARNRSVLHVEERGFVVLDDHERPCRLVGGITDITPRRKAAEQLAQQAALLDKAADAIIVRGLDHRIRFWNRSAERIYGWRAGEAIGANIGVLIYDELSTFESATAALLERGEWTGELAQRRKDGTRLTVEGRWTLIRDELGRPSSVLAINTDISERRALEQQLRQSQRLEAIGQLTGGIAHDFNNLLTVILGNSELLAEQLQSNAEHRPLAMLAEMSRTAAERGAELTQRLLAFARRQALQPRAVGLGEIIAGMEGLLRRTLPASIAIEVTGSRGPSIAFADPAQLEAALLNLCLNARDAMPQGGRLTIDTADLRVGEADSDLCPGLDPGEYIIVAVTDTGTGIPADALQRVFEPFFTTKEPGKGTGLGLSMVYGFARQSGGNVTIDSEPGRGTKVRLWLPAAPASEPHDPPRPLQPGRSPEPSRGAIILVVEDDALVRRQAEQLLTALGHRAIVASDASKALAILRSETPIDMLFTDIVMPGGIDGVKLAAAAIDLRPGLKVLCTSGYAENVVDGKSRLAPGLRLLAKPYRREELARTLRMVLDDSPAPGNPFGRVAEP